MSIRRDRAIEPYLAQGKFRRFCSMEKFQAQYGGEWMTGSIGALGDEIDFSIQPRTGSKRLAVIFNSQQKPNAPLRLFTWTKVGQLLNCSRLQISDPTLNISENATLGWYTANIKGNFQREIKDLISIVRDSLGADELIFLGSSGGGFPAVYYSQVFPAALALLLAPVFNVEKSYQKTPKLQFARELNNADSFEDALSLHPDTVFNVNEIIKSSSTGLRNPVTILQSRNDTGFWEHQTQPFLHTLGMNFRVTPDLVKSDKLTAIFGDWSEGHAPPPMEVINAACTGLAETPIGDLNKFDLTRLRLV